MHRLMGQWSMDPALVMAKRRELTFLVAEVGAARAAEAVDLVIRNHKDGFCPTIAEIRTYVGDPPKRTYCGSCIEGWIYVDPNNRDKGVRRCPCAKLRA